MNDRIECSALQFPLFFLLSPDPPSFKDAIYLFIRNSAKQKIGSSLSNKALQFILCPLVRVETMVGRWNFRKTKIGQFYRGSKAPCFHPLIIPISFHHGGSAVLAGHPCFNKARRSTIEEVEYVWPPFLRSQQPFICMERVALVVSSS